jgi:hypothetical protein
LTGPFAGTIVDPPYVWDPIVYDKGAWILHMLRHVMGDAPFHDLLRDYQAAHRFAHVLTDDFVTAAQIEHGADLGWFFAPWLYQVGQPTYDYTWSFANRTSPDIPLTLHLEVEQVQDAGYPTYRMPIDVDIVMAGGTQHHVVWDSLRTQSFDFPIPEHATDVVLDPGGWILAEFNPIVPGVPGAGETPAAFLAPNVPNPVRSGTSIAFGLSRDATVALRIFDVKGRLVRTLHRGRLSEGAHEAVWDGRDEQGAPVPSGRYFYQLVGPDGVRERPLVVVR